MVWTMCDLIIYIRSAMSIRHTIGLVSITTVVSSARVAFALATRSKARTPGTFAAGELPLASLLICTNLGAAPSHARHAVSVHKPVQPAQFFVRGPQSPKWNTTAECSSFLSRHGSRSNGSSEISHRLVSRVLWLPHVF